MSRFFQRCIFVDRDSRNSSLSRNRLNESLPESRAGTGVDPGRSLAAGFVFTMRELVRPKG